MFQRLRKRAKALKLAEEQLALDREQLAQDQQQLGRDRKQLEKDKREFEIKLGKSRQSSLTHNAIGNKPKSK